MRALSIVLWIAISAPAMSQAPASSAAWTIPANDDIRRVMAEHLTVSGAGMVIGIIEPTGRRVVVHGESHSRDGRALDGDTLFQIGSVTKTFTTLLLADAVSRGEVAFDDPVSRYLAQDVTLHERGRPMTLRDLATHASGLPSMPSNLDLRARPDPIAGYSPRDFDRFLNSFEPERAPGEKWSYSNVGVSLLGRLLARHAGTSYEDLLRERVLEPLGLHDTAITLSRAQARRVAPGLDRYGEPATVWEMRTLQGSGSLRSSANDLLEYLAAILGIRETPLRAAIDLQLAQRSPVRKSQAIGWGMNTVDGREVFGHDGGKAGYRSMVVFDPTNRRGIVILVNARTDERLGPMAQWLINGKALPPPTPAPAPRARVKVDRATLAAYQGRYRFDDGRELAIVRVRDHLIVGTQSDGGSPFAAASSREFFDPSDFTELVFENPGNGAVVTLYEQGLTKGKGITGRRVSGSD